MMDPISRKACYEIAEAVKGGAGLRSAFADEEIFSPTLLAFLEVGEETGKVPHQLRSYSKLLSFVIEQNLRSLFALFLPTVLIFLAFVVLILAVSVVMPLSEVIGAL